MVKSPEIKVNPDVLKTLRESSGYTVEEIAKKIKTTVTKVQEAEKGIASFTLTQIKKLADIYHRSLAAFFTDTLPAMPALTDFRINKKQYDKNYWENEINKPKWADPWVIALRICEEAINRCR